MLLEVKWEIRPPFLVGTVILGFLSIFKKSQVSAPFEALKSHASQSVKGFEKRVHMRRAHRVLSRVSTGDSYITSSSAMKDEPAFKPLQGNLTFFRVRASQYPLYLRQQTQGPSHMTIAEGRVLLSFLWKVGLPLQ